MALTQSAHMAGPSWDEEVVPALRKRLESESRTLARRMSAISLSSVEDLTNATTSAYPDKTLRQRQVSPTSNSSHQSSSSGAQHLQSTYQRQPASDRTMPAGTNRVSNGTSSKSNTKTDFQRARTYSSPYTSDHPNGHANGNARPNATNSPPSNPARSLSPRPVDVKPTRIPKAARPPISHSSSSANSPHLNGSSHSPTVTPFSLSPEQPFSQILPDPRGYYGAQKGIIPSSSTQSAGELLHRSNRQPSGLLNESPPFPTDSTMSSGFTQPGNYRNGSLEEAPPRASTDSEERPYEHWYRGEVSRNGGVGELRVGRRQEMLDIANYGHLIESRKANNAAKRLPSMTTEDDTRRPRKRAGSIAGITNKERERESIYLDEEHVDNIGRVLDENPPTDLDGEGSEVHSLSEAYNGAVAYAYIPSAGDSPSSEWTTVAGAHERSTTPTASMLPRPSSRQQQQQQQANIPPTRIPGPSSRRSSESRSTVNTSPAIGGTHNNQNMSIASSSRSPTISPPAASSSFNSRQPNGNSAGNNTSPQSAAQKRGVSPGSKKTRVPTAKPMAKSKTLPGKQQQEGNRNSMGYYPAPAGEGEDMADAIPSWTQPVPKSGNWDEVVLPVVARKKGLDGYYEEADGSPKPKKIENTVAPAPGTFGFDGTKYRPPRGDFVSIPMDEFGRAAPPDSQQQSDDTVIGDDDDTMNPPTALAQHRQQSPSPAPFSHYAPPATTKVTLGNLQVQEQQGNGKQHKERVEEEEDGGTGCCKCVIM